MPLWNNNAQYGYQNGNYPVAHNNANMGFRQNANNNNNNRVQRQYPQMQQPNYQNYPQNAPYPQQNQYRNRNNRQQQQPQQMHGPMQNQQNQLPYYPPQQMAQPMMQPAMPSQQPQRMPSPTGNMMQQPQLPVLQPQLPAAPPPNPAMNAGMNQNAAQLPPEIQIQPAQQYFSQPQQGAPPFQPQQGVAAQQPQIPVSYEPVDEKTMEEVRRIIAEKQQESGGQAQPNSIADDVGNSVVGGMDAVNPPLVTANTASPEKDATLKEFIQNERNASLFYKYLSGLAAKEEHTSILNTLSQESAKRSQELNGIYKSIYGKEYTVKKSKVNNSIRFKDGIHWAINVENRALRDISDYYDKVDNDRHSKKISSIIHKKFCDLSSLQTISSSTRGLFS